MKRRKLLRSSIGIAAGLAFGKTASAVYSGSSPWPYPLKPIPVIDTHIHLFDTVRPGGVPWPEKTDSVLYQPATPERYRRITADMGIVAAIAVEASPLASDNDWLLGIVAANPIMVGAIGDLVPGDAAYVANLNRFHANPLFLGIRYGNLWNRDLHLDIQKPGFLSGLKLLAHAGLVFESANPDPNLVRALLAVADAVPDLRIVVDHLPHAAIPADKDSQAAYWADLRTLSQHPHVFIKLSEIPVQLNGKLVTEPNYYREKLDRLWELFGEDRCLYGSDWPNSDHVATYGQTYEIVRGYIAGKGAAAAAKFFAKNSISAYKWKPRLPDQAVSL